MAEDFKAGEIVDITIQGVPVHLKDESGRVWIVADACDGKPAHWPMPPQATVERGDPEWWPPQPGDLLRFEGRLLFAVARGSNVILVSAYWAEEAMEPQEAWEKRHVLILVHREEQDGGRSHD